MIIEFIGVSGVGKTTVAKVYKKKLENEGEKVVWDTYDLYNNNNWLVRNIKKAVKVINFVLLNPKWVRAYVEYLNKNISNKKDVYKPLFNAVFLKTQLIKARKDINVHIFDEGVFQYLWAIKLRGIHKVTNNDINELITLLGVPDELIAVEADAETIAKRINARGEYVKIMENSDLLNTIRKMQNVQEDIISHLNDKVIIRRINNNKDKEK